MKSSCITHPKRELLVIIRKSQVEFCEGNQCAAAVMSYFEYWHNWKLDSDSYNKKSNNIAEAHGDKRILSEDVYQFHTLPEISDGILNLYSTKTISEAIKFLESKKILTTHANPNPKYHYDKTKYFRFYPEVYNSWLRARDSRCGNISVSNDQNGNTDAEIFPDASSKNASLFGKISSPITEIYNKDNQSIQSTVLDNFLSFEKNADSEEQLQILEVQAIIDALISKGLSAAKFNYPDTVDAIARLKQAGATVDMFLNAYDIAVQNTQGKGFGVNYLVKVVNSLLLRIKTPMSYLPKLKTSPEPDEHVYENNFKNGMDWMGDLAGDFD
jgi:hypothetical protein